MNELADLAQELGVHERTLRRGLKEGLLHGERPTPRSVELARGERAYLRGHWELLRSLRATLRTEPNVRLAVLIGSAARGRLRADSDIDLLVALADDDRRRMDALRARLERAAGRPVDLVSIESAAARPLLLHDALREGRVLVDRGARWPALLAEEPDVAARAERASQEVRKEMRALLTELSETSAVGSRCPGRPPGTPAPHAAIESYFPAMDKSLTLTAVFTLDENGWTMAQLAEWPAVVTCGRTVEEARAMLTDAAREMIASYRAEGRELPICAGHVETLTIDPAA